MAPRHRRSHLLSLILSNILIPLAVFVFATGFFPYKPFLPGLATFHDDDLGSTVPRSPRPRAVFDRVIFMVVDALRSDFVYGYESGFEFTQSLIRSGAALPFTAHATPPTVTMPRIKALTTGSVPSFLDLILNFAESDTSSSLAQQDTWLAQIRAAGGELVFYGDDTWLKLFPGIAEEGRDFFLRSEGTSSFFVSDFTEVDLNVTRHVPSELRQSDWQALILHYLGLDHIGHKTGPQGPNMLPKQREMDGVVRMIYEAMETEVHLQRTLLVLAGDHGMNAGGNHGGSGPGETEPALLFASPRLKDMVGQKGRREYECPTSPKEGTEFHYYSKVEQSDVVPVLATLLGLPISKNSLGVLIPELAEGVWVGGKGGEEGLGHLERNARQMLEIVRAKYGVEGFEARSARFRTTLGGELGENACWLANGDEEQLACEWAQVSLVLENRAGGGGKDAETAQKTLYRFLAHAQEAMSDTASSYDIPRMVGGMVLVACALVAAVASFLSSFWPPSTAGVFFTLLSLLYGIMMFASSYVEEEQHFWYWLTPAWIALLIARNFFHSSDNSSHATRTLLAASLLLLTHRLSLRWNQTGQKHAGEADIVHTFFPSHHILLWLLILATYLLNAFQLHVRTFADILSRELAMCLESTLVVLAIVFKLNFTQADAPELVRGLGRVIREVSEEFPLVPQARAVFILLGVGVGVLGVWGVMSWSRLSTGKAGEVKDGRRVISMPERLHPLLTLFLMTQTRAPNVPLFLFMEVQRYCFDRLISREPRTSTTDKGGEVQEATSTMEVATTALLFSHATYFSFGGSNSISSIDLSNAYNGVADYNITAVGVLLFASNWAGAIWWCSAAVQLLMPKRTPPPSAKKAARRQDGGERDWVMVERAKLHEDAVLAARTSADQKTTSLPALLGEGLWTTYVSAMTAFVATGLLAVMAACTALRTHLFIWTVFSPKYLYAMAWAVGWHLVGNIGLGSVLYWLRQVG
ncbi:hypothetical protein BDY17DRAFT_249399 [Neohortaea acidophila]|uniref:GPI ethanolamine phosphate transferase 2 n=1 Tax=Neohortaea acidophila TaxID=245834 RepID=A0A6A6PX92_9PEZI|nr:uncharacterized protein BDY17DRAFT_249399 [Neohortaea acidophila]KAF2484652.1 hypothetical protein BDY17DRAFT_249399 [Neohortaea acidophila]